MTAAGGRRYAGGVGLSARTAALTLSAALALSAALLAGGAAAQPEVDDGAALATLDDVRAIAAPCPDAVTHCFGLVVHVAPGADGGLVQTPGWVARQVATANRLFAPLAVGFTITDVRALSADEADIETRADRDRLGRKRFTRGVVHVFVVARLANVDEAGDINGVHWRKGARRWVIVASKAWDLTLGHELGHFLGLPHSEVAASIMNTTARREPPPAERAFQADELERMRGNVRRLVRDRGLRDHARPATGR